MIQRGNATVAVWEGGGRGKEKENKWDEGPTNPFCELHFIQRHAGGKEKERTGFDSVLTKDELLVGGSVGKRRPTGRKAQVAKGS